MRSDILNEKLEIILITYNRKSFLEATLNQIFSETSPIRDLDIKILNNCSNDGTTELIEKYKELHPNIEHVIHNRNIGGNANIARAFEISKKKYVWVLCDDDVYDWTNWYKIEKAIDDDYDVIFTKIPENNIENKTTLGVYFSCATFLPGCIYKTENITTDVLYNMYNNIPNMFPHLALFAKNINENKRIFYIDCNVVNIGGKVTSFDTFTRGLENTYKRPTNSNMFWEIGYYNSLDLIADKKKRLEVLSYPVFFSNLTNNMIYTIIINKKFFNNYFFNYYRFLRHLTFKQIIRFILIYIKLSILSLFIDLSNSYFIPKNEMLNFVKRKKFEKRLDKIIKKYKKKKVLIYGAGSLCESILNHYDLSNMNIVGIVDKQFVENDNTNFYGYKTFNPNEIKNIDFDVMIYALLNPKIAHKCLLDNHQIDKTTRFDTVVKCLFGFIN